MGEIVRGTAREIVHLQKFEQLRKRFPVLGAEFPFLYAEPQLGQGNRRQPELAIRSKFSSRLMKWIRMSVSSIQIIATSVSDLSAGGAPPCP